MNIFSRILDKTGFFGELFDTLSGGYTPVAVSGVAAVHKAHIAQTLSADTPVLLLCADEAAAVKAAAESQNKNRCSICVTG